MRLPFSLNRRGPRPPVETYRAEPSGGADVHKIQQRLAKALNRSEATTEERDVDATEPAANLPQTADATADAAAGSLDPVLGTPIRFDPASADSPIDLAHAIKKEERAGLIAIAAFFLFLGLWSALAPISSAAVAPGVVSPHGSRKTVQHLEGGIIERILVQDGSEVKVGDPLILLEDTMARASYQLIRTQYYTLAAQQARLVALQTGEAHITFPTWLLDQARQSETFEILNTQRQLLMTQRRAHDDRKAVLGERIGQLQEEIKGYEAQIDGQTRQLELIAQEIDGVEQLVRKGLERTPRLLGLQRTEAEIRATRGANKAQISRIERAIGETELQLISADTLLQDDIAQELSNIQTNLAGAGERLAASSDVLNRIQISAPVSGKVVELKFHTPGGIIGSGQPILDIVPQNEDLIIEARVSPLDIDVVTIGMTAQVHLSAFSQRNLPRIEGIVSAISADRLVDPITGQAFFKATIEIDRAVLDSLGADIVLTSGMPAEVMIVTGEQTLLGYLVEPARNTLRRAFREG